MKKFAGRKILGILLLTMLAMGLSHCGQKGGLTRPDPTAFVGVVGGIVGGFKTLP